MIKTKRATTDSITFRLNASVLSKLAVHADAQKTSLNVLVNQILSSYVEWEMDAVKAGWIPTQRGTLTSLIDAIDEKTISDTAKKVAESSGKDIILYMYGKYNLDNLLASIRSSALRSGFHVKEYDEEGNLSMVMQHDLGWKWSLFFKSYYEAVLHDLKQRVIFDYTDTSLVINLISD